jgi:predicted HAD superfamily phosphohydrolase
MIARLDDVFMHRMQGTPAFKMIQDMPSVGANEKAYTMLDIRKRTQVDLDGTAYIGGTTIDYQVMDLIKDSGGLALSFNGSEFAVHGANIAAVGNDCTVAAVLVEQFYDKGIEAVFDLVDHWTRAKVAKLELPDQNLVDSLLVRHPRKLPDVWRVDQSNVGEISAKSEAYRAKLLRPPAQQKKTPVRPAKG